MLYISFLFLISWKKIKLISIYFFYSFFLDQKLLTLLGPIKKIKNLICLILVSNFFAHMRFVWSAALCGMYEKKLRDVNPTVQNLTYDISDLFNFIDGMADLSALV
jgi:Enhancer of rudimentary